MKRLLLPEVTMRTISLPSFLALHKMVMIPLILVNQRHHLMYQLPKPRLRLRLKPKQRLRRKPNPLNPPAVERDLRAEAKSLKRLMTHLPKNPYCDACQRAKMVNVKSFRGDGIEGYDFTKFGEHITLDTMVLHGLTNRGVKR